MNMYNLLFGQNPMSGVLLSILGIEDVPRFRDAFLDTSEDETRIAIYTRTGGGNRDFYECEERCRDNYPEHFNGGAPEPNGPWNCDLRDVEGFIYDADDDFDSTYATFYYRVPDEAQPLVVTLSDIGANPDQTPAERFAALISDLQNKKQTPATARALAVGKSLHAALLQEGDR